MNVIENQNNQGKVPTKEGDLKQPIVKNKCIWSKNDEDCKHDCWMCPNSNDDAVRKSYGIAPSDVDWN